jgi:hypothetical protein
MLPKHPWQTILVKVIAILNPSYSSVFSKKINNLFFPHKDISVTTKKGTEKMNVDN